MIQYKFNDFILDAQQHALIRAEQRINIGSIAYKILLYFVNNPNRTITKDDLISHVWDTVVVSDATLYKQIQRLRDVLGDSSHSKNIIETIHGVGFEFLPEVISLNAKGDDAKAEHNIITVNNTRKQWPNFLVALLIVFGFIAAYAVYQPIDKKKGIQTQGLTLQQAMFTMKNAMVINKKAFFSQMKIRDELGHLLDKRFEIDQELSWERKFFKYYDKMNDQERFIFAQIRAYTDGPMLESNQIILDLINNNPEILKSIPLASELRTHLTIWLNKYHKIFSTNKKMALLYVGVEDGAPYPSEVDNQVLAWLKVHK